MSRVDTHIAHMAAGPPSRICTWRLDESPVMKPAGPLTGRRRSISPSGRSPPGPKGAPAASGAVSALSGHPAGTSQTSRRNASTTAGSGVTIFTWLILLGMTGVPFVVRREARHIRFARRRARVSVCVGLSRWLLARTGIAGEAEDPLGDGV